MEMCPHHNNRCDFPSDTAGVGDSPLPTHPPTHTININTNANPPTRPTRIVYARSCLLYQLFRQKPGTKSIYTILPSRTAVRIVVYVGLFVALLVLQSRLGTNYLKFVLFVPLNRAATLGGEGGRGQGRTIF